MVIAIKKGRKTMNIKSFAIVACTMALAACGDNGANPAKLKGAHFIAAGDGTNITLSFDENEMRAYGQVVNLYNAEYSVDGDKISFGPAASTMMMGPMNAMQTEQEYFQFLSTVDTYKLHEGHLTLKNADGKEIVFQQVKQLPTEEVSVEEIEVVETAK